jgi:RNA polymerase sigma factor (sigma-70 family)
MAMAKRPAWTADELRATMLGVARRRYRLSAADAEDAVQDAFVAYIEIADRYPVAQSHTAIIVGILKKKCLEHLRRASGEKRRLARYCGTPDAARENPWIRPRHAGTAPGVIEELVRAEARSGALDAIRKLRPASRELVHLIAWSGLGRRDLIAHFALNKNTFDSRLRACRGELRRLLKDKGLSA